MVSTVNPKVKILTEAQQQVPHLPATEDEKQFLTLN
jgi:hypothetical protein